MEATKLRWLIKLRWLVLGIELAVVLSARFGLGIGLPLQPLLVVLTLMTLFNGFSILRLRRWGPIRSWELLAQLCVDLLGLTALLYLSGGADNPFTSMFLLPLAMAAVVVPGRYAGYLALAAVGCFGFLVLADRALTGPDDAWLADAAGLHMAGMWACFAISAALIAYFVFGASQALRRTEKLLAEAREQALRNQHLVALGTLATGTAHELGTPLGTMAVLLGDLLQRHEQEPELHEDLVLLKDQVYRCKDILSQLTRSTGVARAEAGTAAPAGTYLQELLQEWRRRRPDAALNYDWQGPWPGPRILAEQTLGQAVLNLVDNAADASSDGVTVVAACKDSMLELEILDRGPGVPKDVRARLGKEPISRKPGGMGVGFLLADATISRLGGQVKLSPRHDGGTRCDGTLPLQILSVEPEVMR